MQIGRIDSPAFTHGWEGKQRCCSNAASLSPKAFTQLLRSVEGSGSSNRWRRFRRLDGCVCISADEAAALRGVLLEVEKVTNCEKSCAKRETLLKINFSVVTTPDNAGDDWSLSRIR